MKRNWKKIAKEVVDGKQYIKLFHQSTMDEYLERLFTIKYLIELDKTKEEIKNFCKDGLIFGDFTDSLLNEEIDIMIDEAKKRKWPKEPESVYITEGEIMYINKLNASMEFKKFVLGMIAYGKYTKKIAGIPLFNQKSDYSYIYYIAMHEDNMHYGKKRYKYIKKYLESIGKEIFNFRVVTSKIKSRVGYKLISDVSYKCDWVDWSAKEGYLIDDLEKDVFILANDKIIGQEKVCENCRNRFFVSPKTQRCLCDVCYKQKISDYNKKYYKKTRFKDQTL